MSKVSPFRFDTSTHIDAPLPDHCIKNALMSYWCWHHTLAR